MTSMTQLTVPNFRTAMRSVSSASAARGPVAMATRSVRAHRRAHQAGGWVTSMGSSRDYGDAPRQTADRNRLQCSQRRRVDDGHVVREAVCNVELAAVGTERELPWPLADQNVLLDFVSPGVDRGDSIGTSQGHERSAAVGRELHADRPDVLLVDTWNLEIDRMDDLLAVGIDHRDGT